ncbi:G8 domain-containing protein [Sorangium sp. So ce260]|uniref:G8 domain-containing protein n=1 Tax=Sorangium sp. So ce260 TaxID=3133291 RepID=UPI003F5DFE5D
MKPWLLSIALLPCACGEAQTPAPRALAASSGLMAVPTVTCAGGSLPPGAGEDLEVKGPCAVAAGMYRYRHVNIWGGGALTFADAKIDFWASSILVEDGGSLIAGTPEAPIGTSGGLVTFHLYGSDKDQPIACKSSPTCGVKADVWSPKDPANAPKVALPGGVTDYFYGYHMNHGAPGAVDEGMFGRKVLALSYNGTIRLFGKKGATFGSDAPASSGTSWVRLAKTPSDRKTLALDRRVDWQAGDEIVVTTTDYLPGHSEQRKIASVSPDGSTITVDPPLAHEHNGEAYDLSRLPARLGIAAKSAETRAAVALLSRSIRVVSEGEAQGQPLGDTSYFGGHTMVRQGFLRYEVQGVEYRQLGQGGSKGHYPVHFHLARKTPQGTFVKDCSVNESMTRWITLHGTHGVLLARNVGYLSIGHGFYLEDGTEIDNKLYANIGIFARAAVDNEQNPRKVPGILASSDGAGAEMVPFHSDYDHPSVFWIMNGWNDFQYNAAVGAGTCGACYWLVPGYNSGPSRQQRWESYASMQDGIGRASMTPLQRFTGNTCSTAMNSFSTVGNTSPCLGVGVGAAELAPVPNPMAPDSSKADYYPGVDQGGGRFATRCDGADCSTVPRCSAGDEKACMVTVLDRYTSSFNWAQTNMSAIWLRPQWYLFVNGFLSDVQNGGLTFVTGGGYTESDVPPGHWALARKSVFVGATQPKNPFASAAGPFNARSGLSCDTEDGNRCLSRREGISMPLDNYAVNQRLFNIYDGPSYQDSNAYLDIRETPLDDCRPSDDPNAPSNGCSRSKSMYGRVLGVPRRAGGCYLPNAAIAWKQPNGFYYPPAFHSTNLFFENVDIRHYVVEPTFQLGTFATDVAKARASFCTFNEGSFNGFTDIDRQTVLNDDDGSLTGLVRTVSVNNDPFFKAPVDTDECGSNGTARTSPYEHVTAVVYPSCAAAGGCTSPDGKTTMWDPVCTTSSCFGVPLYRQFVTADEDPATQAAAVRMASQATSQRSTLTANRGKYYLDTTAGLAKQRAWSTGANVNVFQAGKTYTLFLLFAKPTTGQTYQIYVGKDPSFDPTKSVSFTRVSVAGAPFSIQPQPTWPAAWKRRYDAATGILEVSFDLAAFQKDFEARRKDLCQPASFCRWSDAAGQCQCALDPEDPLYGECTAKNAAGQDAVCNAALDDVTCPEGGCIGFSFTLPVSFTTDVQPNPRPKPERFPPSWNVPWRLAPGDLAGSCAGAPANGPASSGALRAKPRR